jgi:hypothetical protein
VSTDGQLQKPWRVISDCVRKEVTRAAAKGMSQIKEKSIRKAYLLKVDQFLFVGFA